MEIKEFIQEVRNDSNLIELKLEELERLKRLCEVSGINYGGERTDGSRDNQKQEKAILNCMEYRDKLKVFILKAVEKREILAYYIDTLNNHKKIQIMYSYCIGSQSFGRIAKTMGTSRQRVSQLYNEALEELEALTKLDKI